MKLQIIIFVGLLLGFCHAQTVIPAGDCQNLTLFNATDNTSYIEEYCAENATILNITNVTNTTVQNITQNYYCPVLSLTMWANSTQTINNATISCFGNATVQNFTTVNITNITENISACNFSANITPTASEQRLNNITGLDVRVSAIPTNYCYENRNETASGLAVFRSDTCNNTFFCQPPRCEVQSAPVSCPVCQDTTTTSCPEPVACPESIECPVPDYSNYTSQINELSNSIYGESGYSWQLQQKATALADCQNNSMVLDAKIKQATGDVSNQWELALLTALAMGAFWLFKTRQHPEPSRFHAAVTKDKIDEIKRKYKPKEGDNGN